MYLLNAFSLQMINEFPSNVKFEEVETLPNDLVSAIGHQDTANVLGVPMNRKYAAGRFFYFAQNFLHHKQFFKERGKIKR